MGDRIILRTISKLKREVELTQDEFDLVWELLLATEVAMKRGDLNAHRGIVGQGPKDDEITESLRQEVFGICSKMADLVATSDDPIILKIKGD